MANNPYKYWNTWALNFLHNITSSIDSFYLFYIFDTCLFNLDIYFF